ncbi:hypothetical protein V2J09_003671 [Rumex salicifolius]
MSTASDDHYKGGVEYAVAVAAAAFAISMLDSDSRDEELQNAGGPEASLDRIKSQKETIAQTGKPQSETESSSDEEKTEKDQVKVDSSKPEGHDGNEMPEKIIHPVPSTRRRARFALSAEDFEEIGKMKPKIDKQTPSFQPSPPPPPPVPSTRRGQTFSLSSQDFKEIESTKPKIDIRKPSVSPPPPPIQSTRRRPAFSLSSKNFEEIDTEKPIFPPPPPPSYPPPFSQPVSRPIGTQKQRFQESEADAWERAELDKIKKRYEELNLTIIKWEERRKRKAKGKLDKTEGDSGKKRAKALQAYQDDIERIRQITVGARAQAKEKQRKEELKVKEKADLYRETGEPPATSDHQMKSKIEHQHCTA